VIILVRDPYHAIFEGYLQQRHVEWDLGRPGLAFRKHNAGGQRWRRAGKQRQGPSIIDPVHRMIRRSAFDQADFRNFAEYMISLWVEFWAGVEDWEDKLPHGVLFVQLEQLLETESDPHRRCVALGKVLFFLGLDMSGNSFTSGERCTCSFDLAENAQWETTSPAYRPPIRDEALGGTAVEQALSQDFLHIREVFLDDEKLICRIWRGTYMRAARLGYKPFGKVTCPT